MAIAVDLYMFKNNDCMKYGINELMKGVLDPAFEWTQLKIKPGAVFQESKLVDDDHSVQSIPSGPLDPADYPVVPEVLLDYCTPPRYGLFSLYGQSRVNFNISTLSMYLFISSILPTFLAHTPTYTPSETIVSSISKKWSRITRII